MVYKSPLPGYALRVDTGGYGICWNDEIDLSCNELWENGNERQA